MGLTGFQHIVVDDAAGRVFLSGSSGLDVRDLSGAPVSTSLTLGSVSGLALSGDGTLLYVAQPQQDTIAIVDTARLVVTGSISTGTKTCPKSLALLGDTLWFGYGCTAWSGAVGAVNLAQSPAVVSLGMADNGGRSYYLAPLLAASPAVPDKLFVAEPSQSPSSIRALTVVGQSLTPLAQTGASEPVGWVRDLTVSADGKDLLVATTQWQVLRYTTSGLTAAGSYVANSTPVAVAAAQDGRVAVGISDAGQPAVYTYGAAGTFTYQYAYGQNTIAADAGMAFNASGTVLYAVTTGAALGSSYTLHVITNLSDTVRPPAPEILTATPDYRSIALTWQRWGLYDPANVDSFMIYRGTTPGQLQPYTQVPSAKTKAQVWIDTAVAPGTTYYYAVTATNSGGESDRSPVASTPRNDLAMVYVGNLNPDPSTGVVFSYVSDNGPTHPIAPTGHYSDPAASQDGTAVAYALTDVTGTHLWRIPLAGGTAHQLTSGSANDTWPTWSPDGSSIAFTRTTTAGTSIWTVPSAGGTPTAVPGTSGDRQPAWSPNGALLAVTHGTGDLSQIELTSLDGGYRRAVVGTNGNLPHDRCFYSNTAQILCHYSGAAASWSPDGARLAFVQTTPGGGTPAIVTATGGAVDYSLFAPFARTDSVSWSPDNSRIVFSSEVAFRSWAVMQSAPDGTGRKQVGPGYHPSITALHSPYVPMSHPSAVTGFSASLANHAVTLRWSRPADAGYVTIRRSEANGPAPATPADGSAVYTGTAATITATGLVNGASYRFAIFTVSPLGDLGATATLTAAPAAVPTVSPNGSVLSALYAGGSRFTATWDKPLPAGQVYDVQIGLRELINGAWSKQPVWSNLAVGTTATHKVVSPTAGNTYYLRARIRDAAGNTTPWSGTAIAPVPYDDRALSASGAWSSQTGQSGRYLRTIRASRTAGAKLTLTTYGTSYTLIADKCRSCGKVKIYVNGVLKAVADTYAPTTKPRQSIWTSTTGSLAKRTITIVVVGTAGRPTVRIDGLVARR